jgi:competence protein ComEC
MIPSGTTRGERASPASSRSTTSQSYATQHLSNGFIYAAVIALIAGTRASAFVVVPSSIGVLLRAVAVGAAICSLRSRFRRWFFVCLLIVGVAGGANSLHHVQTPQIGVYQGAAKIMEDPQWRNGAVQCVLSIEGQRFIVYAYGLEGRRLNGRQVGEVVEVSALRQRLDPEKQSRYRSRHIVGVATLTSVSESAGAGAPLFRSANRLRGVLQNSTRFMPYEEASLYIGLLIGDDRGQTKEMIAAFRGSGLSHLTAVSGQNVAFLLAVAAPLLVRVKSRWRLIATMFLLGWFVVLTRAEPSVIRATAMAALSAYGVARGRDVPPMRVLAIALGALLLIDPLLAWFLDVELRDGGAHRAHSNNRQIPSGATVAVGCSIHNTWRAIGCHAHHVVRIRLCSHRCNCNQFVGGANRWRGHVGGLASGFSGGRAFRNQPVVACVRIADASNYILGALGVVGGGCWRSRATWWPC